MKRKTRIILIVLAVIAAAVCIFPGGVIVVGMWVDDIKFHTYPAPNLADDAPLPEFVMGEWQYKGPYSYAGVPYADTFWRFEFHETNFDDLKLDHELHPGQLLRMRFMVDPGNEAGGIVLCAYQFVEPELIAADCQRLGESRLSVKRDGDLLLLQWLQWGPGGASLAPLKLTRCRRMPWSYYTCD